MFFKGSGKKEELFLSLILLQTFARVVSEIQLYELLKAKIGEKEAGAFVEVLERRVERKFEENKNMLATKEDLANTKSDILR